MSLANHITLEEILFGLTGVFKLLFPSKLTPVTSCFCRDNMWGTSFRQKHRTGLLYNPDSVECLLQIPLLYLGVTVIVTICPIKTVSNAMKIVFTPSARANAPLGNWVRKQIFMQTRVWIRPK